MRDYGCHVSISGGFVNGIRHAEKLGVNTIQVHPCPPQRWNYKPFAKGYEDEFLAEKERSRVKKVFFHGIYLVNLANPDPKQQENSKLSLTHDLELSSRIGGDGVIFHVGSMKHIENESEALLHVAGTINEILAQSPENSRLIMEVAAGAGKVIGAELQQLRTIYDAVDKKERLGFGLDTQHLWASGYNLQTDIESIVSQFETIFTFEKIWAIHLNDSKSACASKIDRHENIGQGQIGWEALEAFVNHPKLKDIPVMLETPALKDMETAGGEVQELRRMLGIV